MPHFSKISGPRAVYNRGEDGFVQSLQYSVHIHWPCLITVNDVETASEPLFEEAEDVHIQWLQHARALGRNENQPHALRVRCREDLLMDMTGSSVEA